MYQQAFKWLLIMNIVNFNDSHLSWILPTVSTSTMSYPAPSQRTMASFVVLVTPPSVPEAGDGLIKAFMSLESSVIRVLSPNRDPATRDMISYGHARHFYNTAAVDSTQMKVRALSCICHHQTSFYAPWLHPMWTSVTSCGAGGWVHGQHWNFMSLCCQHLPHHLDEGRLPCSRRTRQAWGVNRRDTGLHFPHRVNISATGSRLTLVIKQVSGPHF